MFWRVSEQNFSNIYSNLLQIEVIRCNSKRQQWMFSWLILSLAQIRGRITTTERTTTRETDRICQVEEANKKADDPKQSNYRGWVLQRQSAFLWRGEIHSFSPHFRESRYFEVFCPWPLMRDTAIEVKTAWL